MQEPSLRAALEEAIEALPAELREPFVLIEILGLSYAEASVVVGSPTGTLKSRMHRARSLLMRALEGEVETGEV